METYLRLDRGVYGGVGFSRDLSLRKSGERCHEIKTRTSRGITGESELCQGESPEVNISDDK